jgi:hypothetical protein
MLFVRDIPPPPTRLPPGPMPARANNIPGGQEISQFRREHRGGKAWKCGSALCRSPDRHRALPNLWDYAVRFSRTARVASMMFFKDATVSS